MTTVAEPPSQEPLEPVPVPLIRQALEGAWLVGRTGLAASPPVQPPRRLKPLLGFAKLPVKSLATVREVVDGDEDFRLRVAASMSEAVADRASWLWLTRPEGWQAELAALAEQARLDARDAHETRAERGARRRLEAAESARARSEVAAEAARRLATDRLEELGRERQARRAAEAALARMQADAERAGRTVSELAAAEEAATRRAEEAERSLSELRAALDEMAAERDRLAAERSEVAGDLLAARDGRRRAAMEADDRGRRIGAAVEDAAAAAAALGGALGRAARALSGVTSDDLHPGDDLGDRTLDGEQPADRQPDDRQPDDPSPAAPRPGTDRGRHRSSGVAASRPVGTRSMSRRQVPVPHGLFDDSIQVAEYLVRRPDVTVLVDGYNVSLSTWPGVGLADQRQRLVAALGELAARTGASIHVVFDASAEEQLPPPSGTSRRAVRVGFSQSGEDADEVLIDLVELHDPGRPVVVATDDRRVRTEVERRGANTISVAQLLGVLGRRPHDR